MLEYRLISQNQKEGKTIFRRSQAKGRRIN